MQNLDNLGVSSLSLVNCSLSEHWCSLASKRGNKFLWDSFRPARSFREGLCASSNTESLPQCARNEYMPVFVLAACVSERTCKRRNRERVHSVCVTFHPLGRRRRVGVDVTLEGHGQTLEQREAEAWEAAHHERRAVCNTQQNAWSLNSETVEMWLYIKHMQMEYFQRVWRSYIWKCISSEQDYVKERKWVLALGKSALPEWEIHQGHHYTLLPRKPVARKRFKCT